MEDAMKILNKLMLTTAIFATAGFANPDGSIVINGNQIVEEGARIIDLGGYSSRPGANEVSPDEEYYRLATGLEIIKRIAPNTIVSIDTFRADVAQKCIVDWKADIINDISGGNLDCKMFDTVASLKTPYILMHMRGTPKTMSQLTQYNNVTSDVINELSKKKELLETKGLTDIIIDPGFGFSKTLSQNYELMNSLEAFHNLQKPLLIGISRKSMIYNALNITPETALNGTTVLNTIALMKGAHFLRVHDVKEAVEAVKLSNNTFNQ